MNYKILSVFFFVIILTQTGFSQDDATIPGAKTTESNDLPGKTFFVNPLGILQYGPIIGAEFKLGKNSNSYISPHIRWSFLGVLSHVDWNADYLSPANMGIGLSYRMLMPSLSSKNAAYMGIGMEYGKEYARYDTSETEEYFTGLGFIANGGYRWRFPSGRYVNVGMYAGAVMTLSDDEYLIVDGTLYNSYTGTGFIGMLEFAFGWEK